MPWITFTLFVRFFTSSMYAPDAYQIDRSSLLSHFALCTMFCAVRNNPPRVLLLYCKEGIGDDVLNLADLLTKSGGLQCEFDGYDHLCSHMCPSVTVADASLLLCSKNLGVFSSLPGLSKITCTSELPLANCVRMKRFIRKCA